MEINTPSGYKGLIVRNSTGGAGNLFEAQSAASGALVVIDASGEVGINNSSPGAMLDIVSRASTVKGEVIKGAASQSANLLEIQNSSSTILDVVDSAGKVGIITQTPTGTLDVTVVNSSTKGGIFRGVASQSANLIEVTNSANTAIFAIDNIGRAYQNIAGSGLNWGNTAFGGGALNAVTIAAGNAVSYHTAIGVNALQVANGASYNTCVGFNAGSAITTGTENILIGTRLGAGITTQSYNTIIGNRTAQSATVAGLTAVGCLALANLTTGGDNVAIGFQAGNNVTTGANNIVLGNYSMLGSITGVMSYNIAIGTNTLRVNNASYNVGVGEQALRLASGLAANYNTAIGSFAGYTITTGAGNTFIGTNADVVTNSGAINAAIVIGSGALANQNNQLVIGSSLTKVGKSDGTGEQAATATSPSGISALLETRINGTSYNIPLLPITATNQWAQYASGIIFSNGVVAGDINTASGRINNQNNAVFIGNSAGISSSGGSTANGNRQIYLGFGAGAYSRFTTAIGNKTDIFIGNNAASGYIGNGATLIGDSAGASSSGLGVSAIGIGSNALQFASGSLSSALFIGSTAGRNSIDAGLTIGIGGGAGSPSSGQNNIYIGGSAGINSSGTYNLFMGYAGGYWNVGSGNIELPNPISSLAGTYTLSGSYSNKINIGQVIVGDMSTRRLAIGNVSSSNLSPNSTVEVIPRNASDKVLIVKGAASQTANLQEWQNSAGTTLAYVDSNGSSSGVAGVYNSGVTLSSGIPASTSNKIYSSGSSLFWNGINHTKPGVYFCQGKLAADQSIATGSDVIIQFVDDYDPQGWWDPSTYRFTPTIAGYYSVTVAVWLSDPGTATGQTNVQTRINGNQMMINQSPLNSGGAGQSLMGTKIIYMNGSTDYVDFTVYHNAATSKNIQVGNATYSSGSWFSIVLL